MTAPPADRAATRAKWAVQLRVDSHLTQAYVHRETWQAPRDEIVAQLSLFADESRDRGVTADCHYHHACHHLHRSDQREGGEKNHEELIGEAADLLFHLELLLVDRGISLQDVVRLLQSRHSERIATQSQKPEA